MVSIIISQILLSDVKSCGIYLEKLLCFCVNDFFEHFVGMFVMDNLGGVRDGIIGFAV